MGVVDVTQALCQNSDLLNNQTRNNSSKKKNKPNLCHV